MTGWSLTLCFGLAVLRRGLVLAAIGLGVASGAVSAETGYVARSSPLRAAPGPQADALATAMVAAELEVLERRGGFLRVAIDGWARAGAERVLFAYPNKRILVMRVPEGSVERLVQVGTLLDPDTEATWRRLRIEGWLASTDLLPSRAPLWDAAWRLFAERCTACHERRIPERYSANQWRSLIKVMGPRTGLPKAEQALILAFLQHHASDTIALRSEPGPAAAPGVTR